MSKVFEILDIRSFAAIIVQFFFSVLLCKEKTIVLTDANENRNIET